MSARSPFQILRMSAASVGYGAAFTATVFAAALVAAIAVAIVAITGRASSAGAAAVFAAAVAVAFVFAIAAAAFAAAFFVGNAGFLGDGVVVVLLHGVVAVVVVMSERGQRHQKEGREDDQSGHGSLLGIDGAELPVYSR